MPITLQSFVERFRKSFQLIRDNVEILTTLDAHTGDGDHGARPVHPVLLRDARGDNGEPRPRAATKGRRGPVRDGDGTNAPAS